MFVLLSCNGYVDMASPDEAAAMKRNLVHQTRLELALKQLDRDRSVRLREIDKDTQVFLHRLSERKRSLPSLSELHSMPCEGRITSAPARRSGTRTNTTRPRTSPQATRNQQSSDKIAIYHTSTTCRSPTERESLLSRDVERTRDIKPQQQTRISEIKVRFDVPLEAITEKSKLIKQENRKIRDVKTTRTTRTRTK